MMEKQRKIKVDDGGDITINYNSNAEFSLLTINEDKLKLYLNEYKVSIENRGEWKTAVALFITLLIAVLSMTFNDLSFASSTC